MRVSTQGAGDLRGAVLERQRFISQPSPRPTHLLWGPGEKSPPPAAVRDRVSVLGWRWDWWGIREAQPMARGAQEGCMPPALPPPHCPGPTLGSGIVGNDLESSSGSLLCLCPCPLTRKEEEPSSVRRHRVSHPLSDCWGLSQALPPSPPYGPLLCAHPVPPFPFRDRGEATFCGFLADVSWLQLYKEFLWIKTTSPKGLREPSPGTPYGEALPLSPPSGPGWKWFVSNGPGPQPGSSLGSPAGLCPSPR